MSSGKIVAGRDGWTGIEGSTRGPHGPKKCPITIEYFAPKIIIETKVIIKQGESEEIRKIMLIVMTIMIMTTMILS